tara:strand:- start:43 stop:594 length:552 start_codon:yes stop_codon:yes gene_type:complete
MKIVFCIPGKKFSGTFLQCWTYLTKKIPSNIEWFMVNGYIPNISYSRQALLDRAKMFRPTHYMWIDDDQVFDYNQFQTLLDHNLDIISGIYKKSENLFACAKLDGTTLTVDDKMDSGINEVMANGMGFMLVKSEVFDRIDNPFEFLNKDQWEDFGFANKARQLGYKVNIDTTVVVGHQKLITI